MLNREQEEEENEEVLVVSLRQEEKEELDVSETEDEKDQVPTPLITACCKSMTEVSYAHVCVLEKVWLLLFCNHGLGLVT